MNLALATTFRQVATDLLSHFGRPVVHTNADGDEATIQAVLEQEAVAVGDYGERMEPRWAATLSTASGARVGDTLTVAADDPDEDDPVWTLTQALDDDGFVQRFALRAVTS